MSKLISAIQLEPLTLPNRVIMAPLTRRRSGDHRIPTPLMADYCRQRAGAGLILAEATSVSEHGVGYLGTPGLGMMTKYTDGL